MRYAFSITAAIAAMAADPTLAQIPVLLMIEPFGAPPPVSEGVTRLTKPIRFAELLRIRAAQGITLDRS